MTGNGNGSVVPGGARDRNGLEVLDDAKCRELLAGAAVGRLGVSTDALPAVLPVNFVVDGDRIVIRTNAGTKLDAAVRGAVVAFEADQYDALDHSGWSVMVVGRATEITDPADVERVRTLPLRAWGVVPADRYVAITIEVISGRRVGTAV